VFDSPVGTSPVLLPKINTLGDCGQILCGLEEAARRIARAIAARRRLAVIPWQMALVSMLLRLAPAWLYDRIAARAPRKPRDLPL